MARLHHVKSARKSKKKRKCWKCSKPIKAGDSYYWFANRMGRVSFRKDYCAEHRPRASNMTTSDKLSRLYAAQEGVEDQLGKHEGEFNEYRDGIAEALREAANEARNVGQEYRDSKDNMPEGLQEGEVGQQCEEHADLCEQWADLLEQAADSIESLEKEESDEDFPWESVDDEAGQAVGELEL